MQINRGQIDSLTGLRGVAACWVMLMHFREITPTRLWQFPILDDFIANGAYGVDIFFVLSGFILCHVYTPVFKDGLRWDNVRQFLSYRFARLYPVHLLTFGLMLAFVMVKLLLARSGDIPDRYDLPTIATTLVLLQAWIPGIQTPNMPAWSISAEWFAYLLFPVLCILLSYGRWISFVFMAAGLSLAVLDSFWHYPLSQVLSGFLVGMAAYRVLPMASRILAAHEGMGVLAAVLIIFWARGPSPRPEIGILLFAVLIPTIADARDLLGRFLSTTILVYLGEISYSIYMVHWPVRVVLRNALQITNLLDRVEPSLVVLSFVIATLIAASVSYHLVELPSRTWLRRALGRFHGSAGRASTGVNPVA
jgi:peptidoglycan/LPS O-acetylase OafA/YrhL